MTERTEAYYVWFKNGLAEDWIFDVPEAFRDTLDIKHVYRKDKICSTTENEIFRRVLTRGMPPATSFEPGHIFYDPPGTRAMVWEEALKRLRRSVQVKEVMQEKEIVRVLITYFESGRSARTEERKLRQRELELYLRFGEFI